MPNQIVFLGVTTISGLKMLHDIFGSEELRDSTGH